MGERDVCPVCGHRHAGVGWGGICVGCPCPVRPADEPAVGPASAPAARRIDLGWWSGRIG